MSCAPACSTTRDPRRLRRRLERDGGAGADAVCANPDVVVHRGADLHLLAGALAQAYEALGGETIYAGKPHAPIYHAALAAAGAALKAPLRALARPGDQRRDGTTSPARRAKGSTRCSSPPAFIATR